jgi:hypothetical protein
MALSPLVASPPHLPPVPAQAASLADGVVHHGAGRDRGVARVGLVAGDPLAELWRRAQGARAGEALPPFTESRAPVGLYLRAVTLNESFDWGLPRRDAARGGWLGPRAAASNEVYVVTVAWDLSGRQPVVYPLPAAGLDPARLTRSLGVGDRLELLGDGLAVWPSARVTGGLYANVFVMESDSGARSLGASVAQVAALIEKSPLAGALSTLGGSTPDGATAAALLQAGLALTQAVAVALQQDGDDLVGVFYGTYGVDGLRPRLDHYDDRGASIELALVPSADVPVPRGGPPAPPSRPDASGAHAPPRPAPGRFLE